MKADVFLEAARDPLLWKKKSSDLRRSADRLWDAFGTCLAEWASQTVDPESSASGTEKSWSDALGYFTSARLLYGLALETAFKAAILAKRPSDVQFKMTTDGAGQVLDAEFKQFGVAMGVGHNLEQLATRAGFFDSAFKPEFLDDTNERTYREVLRYLSDTVYWEGRYPVPVKSGTSHEIPADVPGHVFGHFVRDFVDAVLDYYAGVDEQSEA